MALTRQLEIKKMLPETYPQATMIKTIPQLRSALIGYVPNQYQPGRHGLRHLKETRHNAYGVMREARRVKTHGFDS